MKLVYVISFLLSVYNVFVLAAEEIPKHDITDTPYTWSEKNEHELIITADSFYISADVDTCDIEGDMSLSYLLLKTGDNTLKEHDDGRYLYHITKHTRLYFHSDSVYLSYKTSNASIPCQIHFQITDKEITTTPIPTTTENIWPTHSPNISGDSTVNISGHAAVDYKNKKIINSLKTALVLMAQEYAETMDFKLAEKITTDNILIHILEECPINWPDSDKCIRMTYSLPLILQDEHLGYQLTQEHLDIMWARLAKKYLPMGMSVYEEPEVKRVVRWWLITVTLVSLAFLAFLISAKLCQDKRKRRMSDTVAIVSKLQKSKLSNVDLSPHYIHAPAMFEGDTVYSEPLSDEETDRNGGIFLSTLQDDSDDGSRPTVRFHQ